MQNMACITGILTAPFLLPVSCRSRDFQGAVERKGQESPVALAQLFLHFSIINPLGSTQQNSSAKWNYTLSSPCEPFKSATEGLEKTQSKFSGHAGTISSVAQPEVFALTYFVRYHLSGLEISVLYISTVLWMGTFGLMGGSKMNK